jgi:hypothetical protein
LPTYHYYEFRAIDRPLKDKDRTELQALSRTARITAKSFVNSYDMWSSFGGDPTQFMRRWFDLHLHRTTWGEHRLMIRLPKQLVQREAIDRMLRRVECAKLKDAGANLILDICRDDLLPIYDESEDEGLLSELAPLRADLLSGDMRLFYLLWLTAVETDAVNAEDPEPLPGLGPVEGALQTFAEFFQLDLSLVQAAAERPAAAASTQLQPDAMERTIASANVDAVPRRTAGELRARAEAMIRALEEATIREAEVERQKAAEAEERARRARLPALALRGEAVWPEIEAEIARRNPAGYKRAFALLQDMKALAAQNGTTADFSRRVHSIRERHARKGQFIERLEDLG